MSMPRLPRRPIVVMTHATLWTCALGAAFYARFDGDVPADMLRLAVRALPVLLLVRVATFWSAGLFHGLLRYAGMPDLRAIVRWTTLGTLVLAATGLIFPEVRLPRSIYMLEWLMALAVAGGLRFTIRMFQDRRGPLAGDRSNLPPAIMIGAGNAAELLIRDSHRSPTFRIAAILDDDRDKHGALLHGVRVVGGIDTETLRLASISTGATRAILVMPTAPGYRTREILEMCRSLGIALQTVPSLQQIADGDVRVSVLRDVAIEDLLRRDPVQLDQTGLAQTLAGKRVLVTGAAGSIGSELVRQIARFGPATIVLYDHNENGLFYLEREVLETFPGVDFVVRVGDVRDVDTVNRVFDELLPTVVYHAAAHKHVPLMEANPAEAVRNNVLGTRVIADAAADHHCDVFVLISTDKAVNPTSVMGATKRLAEMYVQSLSGKTNTRFAAVRFGNVLGSAGSVVPIFRTQIEAGGPVRVTHPDMRRYFMTIPEACQLVLQASALGNGGEIFILDMGEPVRIVDLARDMIALSGLIPEQDIAIEFTGIRPGEKLYEELMFDDEAATATAHPKIRVAHITPQPREILAAALDRLDRLTRKVAEPATIRAELTVLVPEARFGSGTLPPPAVDASKSAKMTVLRA